MGLAEKLFFQHFDDPVDALRRFERNLGSVGLPFDVLARLREIEYPPYPGYDQGMPSFIYYFVPGTGWVTFNKASKNPIAPEFVSVNDGVGLNLGCPVRLARALELLSALPEEERAECVEGLRARTKHLAAIEELLWMAVWHGGGNPRRGGATQGSARNVDWFLTVDGITIFLEVKFRPADWPRLTDQGTHRPMDGFLLGKAAEQFARKKTVLTRNLVGVTGFDEPSDLLASICEEELTKNDHVHAVLYRTMRSPVYVFTRHEAILKELMPLFAPYFPDEFPQSYFVSCDMKQRDDRIVIRGSVPALPFKSGSIYCGVVSSRPSKKRFSPPPDPYHMTIAKYLEDGEPVFKVLTKYLYPDAI